MLIEGIDPHSTVDAFATNDPLFNPPIANYN